MILVMKDPSPRALWLWDRNGTVNNLDNEKIQLRSYKVKEREGTAERGRGQGIVSKMDGISPRNLSLVK